jgi:hypothetical protein
MAKSYSEQLEDWVEEHGSSRRDRNLVKFLAVRDDVKQALDAGYFVSTIWGNMRETGRIDFAYDTFLKYVNRIVRSPAYKRQTSATNPKRLALDADRAAKPATPQPITGFTFNPSVKKEDLI